MKLKDYFPFYKRNLKVAFPVMITQAGQVVMQLADNVMVGHLGAAQLAGTSFANAIFIIGLVFCIGFCQGITPLVGQSFGKGDSKEVGKLLGNAIILNFILGVILSGIMGSVLPFMGKMGQDPEVFKYAHQYYSIIVFTMFPAAIFFTTRFFSDGIGNTKNAMWITLFVNVLNIFLNWVLIYGHLGFPAYGVAGAAYSTLTTRLLATALFILLFICKKEYNQYLKIIKWPFFDWKYIKDIFKISLPISFQSLLEVTAFSFAAIMVGWMGKYELAAHQIAQSLSHLSFMIATGIGAAATIRVSHQYGGGNYVEMRMAGKASIHMSAFLMGSAGLIFIIFRHSIPPLFTPDVNATSIASSLIIVLSLFQIFDAIQLSSMSSLRGLKDTTVPLMFSAISYYCVCLPSAYVLGFICKLGPVGVWIGLMLGLIFASTLFYLRFNKLSKRIVKENSL
jgi:multidrug resistance protein, MATE family